MVIYRLDHGQCYELRPRFAEGDFSRLDPNQGCPDVSVAKLATIADGLAAEGFGLP